MKFYLMNNVKTPWGDWGSILWTGMTSWNAREGKYEISRVGPFSPDIYIGDNGLVFSEAAMIVYSSSGLRGVSDFLLMRKKKVVNIDWKTWDRTVNISSHIDDLFEPEDLIALGENDPELIDMMSDYYLAIVDEKVDVDINRAAKKISDRYFIKMMPECDLFTGSNFKGFFVSENARAWFDKHYPEHFDFHEVYIKF